jgi:predicted NACHT family NTPase
MLDFILDTVAPGTGTGVAANWIWEKYKAIGLGDTLIEAWQKTFNWNDSAKAYQQRIAALYGTVRILGKSSPVPLEGIFTDVYILDKRSAERRFDIQQLREDPSRLKEWEAERKNGLEVVKHYQNSRLFILGKPGAGKTTFLKYIALQAVQRQLDRIPIFISLKEWSDSGLELMPFLVRQFEICKFPQAQPFIEHILTAGHAIVLFDGLDEVQQERDQRARLIDVLRDFSKQYLASPCLITCRIAATDYSFDQFTYVEVADFTEDQIHTFVNKWFRDDSKKGEMFLVEFAKDDHKGLRDLGRIPLLLTLLCLAFEETLHFPARRVEIYEEALEALLKKWDTSRNIRRDEVYRKLSLGRKRQMLARIAAETFEKGEYLLPQKELAKQIAAYLQTLPPGDKGEEEIEGDVVLKAIEAQHGIFVERAHQIYSFSHLTFQEYFTAKYIAENVARRTLEELIKHWEDARWREVFLLTASLLDNADAFFGLFKRAIDDLVKGDEQLVKLLELADKKANSVETPYKVVALRSFYHSISLFGARDLDLTLDLTHALTHALTRDLAIASASALARNLARALDFVRDRALDLDFVRALDFVRDLVRDLDFVRDLVRDLVLKIDLLLVIALQLALVLDKVDKARFQEVKQNISSFPDYFKEVVNSSQQAGFPDLYQALKNLTVPNENDRQSAWQPFAKALREIMQKHRDIGHEWNLTEEQINCLERYFQANLLLVKCLKLAVVSDREGIERSLLTVGSGE